MSPGADGTQQTRKWARGSAAGGAAAPGARRARELGARPGGARGRGLGEGFGNTEHRDAWWCEPALQGLTLLVLGAYATWAAFQGNHYEFGGYLSPFYSPLLKPDWWPFSPALLV